MDKNKIINKFSINMSVENFNFENSLANNQNLEVMERIKNKIHSHPLHSRMKVRIFYKGRNRNGSFIDEIVEKQLIDTLPNTPIVGEYWDTVEDFGTHGMDLRSNEVGVLELKRTTIPFGVIPSDTEVWYELITDKDGVERNYVCCEVVLWSKRYNELNDLIESGRPQSMELDPDLIDGEWIELEDDFVFKYSQAYLSALCILGQEIEPCFEGSSFSTFSIKNSWSDFKKECQEMFNDIKASCKIEEETILGKFNTFQLSKDNEEFINKNIEYETMNVFTTGLNISNKGGKFKMGEIKLKFSTSSDVRETLYKSINAFNADNDIYDFKYVITNVNDNVATIFSYEDNTYYTIKFTVSGNDVKVDSPIKSNVVFQTQEESLKIQEALNNYANLKADNTKINNELTETRKKMKDHQLTNDEFSVLKANSDKFEEISEEYNTLKEYMLNNERSAKQEIIKKFSKLGEAELKIYKDNIDKYNAEQLDEKLSALAFKKGITLNQKAAEDTLPTPVYSYKEVDDPKIPASGLPSWFTLVSKREDELNNFCSEE